MTAPHPRTLPAQSQAESALFERRPSSLWHDALRRLLRNPEAIIGLVIIVVFLLIALFADQIAPFDLNRYDFKSKFLPPAWVETSSIGYHGDPRYLLGTDRNGFDLFSWMVIGTRTSMLLGIVSAPLIALFGMLVGLVAGYAGGRVDNWIMRLTDVFYAFPPLIICILVVLALRDYPAGQWLGGLFMLFIAFLSVGWAGAARLVRSSVLAIKNSEYIEAARCLGVPTLRLLWKHVLPNSLGPLLVWVTLMVPQIILTEAVLGYLRINPGPAGNREGFFVTSWGRMIMEGRTAIHIQPIQVLIPAVCVGLISIAFSFLGDALRDAIDPETRAGKL